MCVGCVGECDSGGGMGMELEDREGLCLDDGWLLGLDIGERER